MNARITIWLAEHRRAQWSIRLMGAIHFLCLWSVIAAPRAAADVGAAAIGWTGIKDTDGVPLESYFLSVVDTSEAVANNGQGVSAIDPSTWVSWMVKATQVAVTHSTMAWWLTNEAALIVFVFAISLWFLRFAMSSSWLLALAQIGRPIFAAVSTLVNNMWLGPLVLTVCVTLAGFHYLNGRPGRAWNLVGTAAIMLVLSWTLFKDPIDDLVSDHGLLGMGRATGFQIAQAARNGSYAPGASLQGQLDAFLSQMVSATARPALQLQNFGMVVDDVGTCRRAWSQAIIASGRSSANQDPAAGPAHAMAGCGAPQALAHAQHLGANDFVLGLFLLAMAMLVGLFIWYVGISTMLVGAKATYYGIVVGPAILLGMTGWKRAKNYATRAVSQVFLHAAEMILYTTFLAITAVGMGWTLTTPTLGHGGITVVPRLLMVGLGSIVAILLFHYIDKHFYTDGLGTIGHQISGVWQSARAGVQSEYDDFQQGVDRMRRGRDRFAQWRSRSAADEAEDAEATTGAQDAPEFDVVKARPVRQPAPAGADAAGAPAEASEVATTAGRAAAAGESTEVVAAAEAAGTVIAPEVAVPVAAAAYALHHARQGKNTSQPSEPASTRTHSPGGADIDYPLYEDPSASSNADHRQWAHDDRWPSSDASLPPLPSRPPATSRRQTPAAPSHQAPTNDTPPPAVAGGDRSDPAGVDPALEFPPTPAASAPTAKDDHP